MKTCKNCNEPIEGNYCPNCGRVAELKRIDIHYVINEIASVFYAEKGWLYTLINLTIRPGDTIRKYITEDRVRLIKPVMFVIVTSLIYTIVSNFFHIDAEEFQQQISGETETMKQFPIIEQVTNWMIDNSGYLNLISGFLTAFFMKLFFRKSGYNLCEIFVLCCYLAGIGTLISSVFFIIQGLTNYPLILIATTITAIYHIWGAAQFFDKKKINSYIKTFLSYFIVYLCTVIILTIILIVNVIKNM